MKILFVCLTNPIERGYGGQQRTHIIWKGLCSVPGADVKVLVLVPHRSQEKVDLDNNIYNLCFEKRYTFGWFLQRLVKKCIPYWDCSWAYDWRSVHRFFAGTNVVVARYIQPVAAVRLWELAPLYIDADDIHTREYDAHTQVCGNSLWRRVVRFWLGKFQNRMYEHAYHIWLPAMEQMKLLSNFPVSCLPNIPCGQLPDFSSILGSKDKLLFVGYMCTDPNIVAVDWFLDNFWDDIKKVFPKIELNIVGSGVPEKYREKWGRYHDVHLLGFVKDIYSMYQEALALITPMKIGMGSCIKVLESLGVGRCVISTSHGLRGISMDARIPSNGMFQFEDFEGLCKVLTNVQSISCRLMSQRGGRVFIESNYTQQSINKAINDDIVSNVRNK